MEYKNGQGIMGEYGCVRWCDSCKRPHARLYPCPHYHKDILVEMADETTKFRKNLLDTNWVNEQLKNGLPPEGVEIFKFFAGVL